MKEINYFLIFMGVIVVINYNSQYNGGGATVILPDNVTYNVSCQDTHQYDYNTLLTVTPEQQKDLNIVLKYCSSPYCIDQFVENAIEYEFFWFPNNLTDTLTYKMGDCSDKALLKYKMMVMLGYNVKFLHADTSTGKHDFIGWYINDTLVTYEYTKYNNLTVRGEGLW